MVYPFDATSQPRPKANEDGRTARGQGSDFRLQSMPNLYDNTLHALRGVNRI